MSGPGGNGAVTTGQSFSIRWIDGGREPRCAPDPAFPHGRDVDVAFGAPRTCTVQLPYPAQRCGIFLTECRICGQRVALTTAGRPDDPRALTVGCLLKE